jgi:hypothetical protein
VEKESSNDITTTTRFGFEVSKWFGENKGGDGKGPRDEKITLSYITTSPPTTLGFLLEKNI